MGVIVPGLLSGGYFPGDYCPGDYCPRSILTDLVSSAQETGTKGKHRRLKSRVYEMKMRLV